MSFNPIISGSAWKMMPRMPIPRSHRASGAAPLFFATAAGGARRQKGRPHAGHTRSAGGRGAPPPAAAYPGDGVGDPGGRGRRGAKEVLVNRAYTCMFRSDVTV